MTRSTCDFDVFAVVESERAFRVDSRPPADRSVFPEEC